MISRASAAGDRRIARDEIVIPTGSPAAVHVTEMAPDLDATVVSPAGSVSES